MSFRGLLGILNLLLSGNGGKKTQNTTLVHRIDQIRKEVTPVKYFNATEDEIMTI